MEYHQMYVGNLCVGERFCFAGFEWVTLEPDYCKDGTLVIMAKPWKETIFGVRVLGGGTYPWYYGSRVQGDLLTELVPILGKENLIPKVTTGYHAWPYEPKYDMAFALSKNEYEYYFSGPDPLIPKSCLRFYDEHGKVQSDWTRTPIYDQVGCGNSVAVYPNINGSKITTDASWLRPACILRNDVVVNRLKFKLRAVDDETGSIKEVFFEDYFQLEQAYIDSYRPDFSRRNPTAWAFNDNEKLRNVPIGWVQVDWADNELWWVAAAPRGEYCYKYTGPVLKSGQCVMENAQASVYAISERRAKQTLIDYYKQDYEGDEDITLPGELNRGHKYG